MRNFIETFALVFLFVPAHVLFGTIAFAQTDRTTLEGVVTDSTGGSISGADVKIVEVATGFSQAQSKGFRRRNLPLRRRGTASTVVSRSLLLQHRCLPLN